MRNLERENSAPFVAARRAGFLPNGDVAPTQCPFCAGLDLRTTTTAVWCMTCGASGPGPVEGFSPKVAWNTRAEPPAK